MAVKNARTSLDRISKSLARTQDAREFLLKNTREVIVLCSKSIIAVHGGDMEGARSNLQAAGRLLVKYRKKSEAELRRYLVTPEQEFVEAAALIAIVEKRQIPSKVSLKVSDESYVLGLLDCIGELKRLVLDKIRNDSLGEALRVFRIMEELFALLYPFASLDKVVKETRRKLDVDRMLVEDTRAVITEEIRRKDLIEAIRRLER